MDETRADILIRRWILYFVICSGVILIHLIPLDLYPARFSAPDLILTYSFALVIREGRYIPWPLAGSIFLLADILLNRPLGLWALLSLAAIEIVRANRIAFREMFFITEWVAIAAICITMGLAQQFILAFALSPSLDGAYLSWQIGLTILSYPIVVFLTSEVFGLRKAKPGSFNALGQKI